MQGQLNNMLAIGRPESDPYSSSLTATYQGVDSLRTTSRTRCCAELW